MDLKAVHGFVVIRGSKAVKTAVPNDTGCVTCLKTGVIEGD
jgi:hypothetical protein